MPSDRGVAEISAKIASNHYLVGVHFKCSIWFSRINWQYAIETDGKVDGFTCAVGSGGTLAGIARALKERNPDVKIALSDPMGAALYNWFTRGELTTEGDSITEGTGSRRLYSITSSARASTA
jgi:cysteine synthase